ncbi:MAG: ArsR family transcriptional regulator [Thermoprotei archaeon]|nr:MAG: ArsR family transcriptional regulator [Thermoprotei archaeon]RLF18431.1 MAG: ArsR family transcriptional regulator [Thermoprotei archaeon]
MIRLEKDILVVSGDDIVKVASALTSTTRLRILKLLRRKCMTLKEIANEIGKSKANTSIQIKQLEELKLVDTRYVQSEKGLRKVCISPVKEIRFILE